jgi:hypothetical protein
MTEYAKTNWEGTALTPPPKEPEPLRSVWGAEVNAPLTKKEQKNTPTIHDLTPEETDLYEERIEFLINQRNNESLSLQARERADRECHQLFVQLHGDKQVHGSKEAFPEGLDRVIGETGAPSRGDTYTLFTKSGFNAQKKNRWQMFHKTEDKT